MQHASSTRDAPRGTGWLGSLFLFLPRRIAALGSIFRHGNGKVRLSFLVMGLGCLTGGRVATGLFYLAVQILFLGYFCFLGIPAARELLTLGTRVPEEVWDDGAGVFVYTAGDNSMLILLYGVLAVFAAVLFVALWAQSIRVSAETVKRRAEGERGMTVREEIASLGGKNFHISLLILPCTAILVFTVLPILFMVLIAFTNYDRFHMPPGNLFDWVGLENFRAVLGLGENGLLSSTFRRILSWTLVWALFATALNYILGMALAILINRRGIRAKKLFRSVFVTTVAIPQFVSLLFMRNLLSDYGLLNVLLREIGWIDAPIRFLTDGNLARITVLAVNLWIGVPYSMLITTGILMNIPADLYEASRIDGASPLAQFWHITLPYVLFVTGPYLITQFIGNLNNFGVIWLLSGGGPMSGDYYQGGKTDLLITWLYRITTGEQNYKLASVIGILTFAVSAVFSLIVYSRALKGEEGDFQ